MRGSIWLIRGEIVCTGVLVCGVTEAKKERDSKSSNKLKIDIGIRTTKDQRNVCSEREWTVLEKK